MISITYIQVELIVTLLLFPIANDRSQRILRFPQLRNGS